APGEVLPPTQVTGVEPDSVTPLKIERWSLFASVIGVDELLDSTVPSSLVMVPVAVAVPSVTVALGLLALVIVSVKLSSGCGVVSPEIVMVRVAEVAPSAKVPLKVEFGSVPPKSAALVVPAAKVPEKLITPVVPPVRWIVKVMVLVPLSPSVTDTLE